MIGSLEEYASLVGTTVGKLQDSRCSLHTFIFLIMNIAQSIFCTGMFRQKCPNLRMMRVMRRGFQEKGTFGEPSWVPQLPNTINQSEYNFTVISV